MIVKACQATKKDVITRCMAEMRKEKEALKIHYLEEAKKIKQDMTAMIDLKKFHRIAMTLHQDPLTIKSLQNQIKQLLELKGTQERDSEKLRANVNELSDKLLQESLEKSNTDRENQRLMKLIDEIESLKTENENLKRGYILDQSKFARYQDIERELQHLKSQNNL